MGGADTKRPGCPLAQSGQVSIGSAVVWAVDAHHFLHDRQGSVPAFWTGVLESRAQSQRPVRAAETALVPQWRRVSDEQGSNAEMRFRVEDEPASFLRKKHWQKPETTSSSTPRGSRSQWPDAIPYRPQTHECSIGDTEAAALIDAALDILNP